LERLTSEKEELEQLKEKWDGEKRSVRPFSWHVYLCTQLPSS
jgi:hypothetical protein